MICIWVGFLKCRVDSVFVCPSLVCAKNGDFIISHMPRVYYNYAATVWFGAM